MISQMKTMLRLCSLLVLLLIPVLAAAEVVFPKTGSYVDDLANVLSPQDEQRLGDLARDLDRKAGYQMLFVTVPSLEGEDIAQAATRYGNEKAAGRRSADTGIVLMQAVGDRKVFIATGRGTEAVVTDIFAGEVFRNTMRPLMREGRVGDAFYQGAVRLRDRILQQAGDTSVPNPIPESPPAGYPGGSPGEWPGGFPGGPHGAPSAGPGPFFLLIIGFIIIVAIARAASASARCPRCRSYLRTTRHTIRKATRRRSGYGVQRRQCPVCGLSLIHI